jgi:vancomycin resistance protein YoaR
VTSSTTLGRPARIGAIAVGTVVLLLIVALAVLWFVQRDRVLPNTTVADVDASGLTEDELRDRLAPIVESRETATVTFTFEGEEHVLVPEEVGYRIDVDETVQTALARGREGLPGDVGVRVRAYRDDAHVQLQQVPDQGELRAWVDDLADQLDREEIRGDVEIDPDTAEVTVSSPQGEVVVDRDATYELALEALLEEGEEELELPTSTTDVPIAEADVQTLAAQAEAAVDGPLVLRAGDASLTLEPTDLARLIEVETTDGGETGTTLQLVVTEDRVEEVMGDVARGRFDIEPVSASYTSGRGAPETFDEMSDTTYTPVAVDVGIEEGRMGVRFDPAMAAGQLQELLREGVREAEIGLADDEPELSDERAQELRPTHSIGTFTTYYQADQDRNDNIRLLADEIDGALVLPGEQFSINDISGERTCERGYVPAGTIVDGELVDTCGGGTSQFGTTTFNAAFFAGVQLDQWQAHSWYISRYPMGREATLSYPVLDVRFTNTTDGAILVRTDHDDTSVTVTLLGQPRADAVSATHSEPFDQTEHGEETRTSSSLSEGQEEVVQGGTDGFTVEVTRTVELVGGGEETQEIRTVYQPQTRIVERGAG